MKVQRERPHAERLAEHQLEKRVDEAGDQLLNQRLGLKTDDESDCKLTTECSRKKSTKPFKRFGISDLLQSLNILIY